MIFKFRAGAVASAAMMFVAVSGVASTSARAEVEVAMPIVSAATPADETAGLRFVAEPVVQTLPIEDSLEQRVAQATSLQELVGDMPIDAELSSDMKCLADAVYFEARGEPLAGQLAVARVVINRAASGIYPSDYCSVVTQRKQFSFVRNGRIPHPDEHSTEWLRAKAIAQIAHQDLWQSEADDALYFHATYVHPGWANQKIKLARIDTHIFYR
jgi:spore germination cell wall hydrolase CwlJ-like protein